MNKVATIAEREKKLLEQLASRIRYLRRAKGMSQNDVVVAASISRTTLHNLENAANAPSLHLLVKIGVALDVPVHLLIAPIAAFKEFVKNVPIPYNEEM